MSEKKIAPELRFKYSTKKNDGTLVKGHKTRCDTLEAYWNYKFEINEKLLPIFVYDIAEEGYPPVKEKHPPVHPDRFVIEITDTTRTALSSSPHIVINHNIGAENYKSKNPWFSYFSTTFLFGKDYFIAPPAFSQDINYYVNLDNEINVVIVPGGDIDGFLSQIDINYVAKVADQATILTSVSKDNFINKLMMADIVITTPSMAGMESISLGNPTLLIKTSSDQKGEFIQQGYAEQYSAELLDYYVKHHRELREGIYNKKRFGSGLDRLISEIYIKWEKFNKQKEGK